VAKGPVGTFALHGHRSDFRGHNRSICHLCLCGPVRRRSSGPVERSWLFPVDVSFVTIPMLMVRISLFLFLRTRAQGIVANRLRFVFFIGVIMMVVVSSINIVLFNVYFRSEKWVDNLDLVNHLSYIGELMNQMVFKTCGVVAILLIRSFLRGERVGTRAK